MPSIISATTTNGVSVQGDNSGSLQLATNNGTTAVTIDTSQRVAFVAGTDALPAITTTGDTNTGIFFPTADTIAFAEGGAEAMRIDSSGQLNIGSTTQNGTTSKLYVRQATDGGFKGLSVISSASQQYVGSFSIISGGILDINQSYLDGSGSYQPISFTTSGSERMRIDSSGNLLVGNTATSGNAKFFVDGSVTDNISRMFNSSATPYGLYIRYSGAAPNNTGQEFLFLNDTGATRFTARSNGGLANYSANNVNLSDAREKTNIELAGNYLSKICSIPVKTFNYIDQNREDDDGLTLGVIAQDVEAIAPELVSESDWSSEKDGSKMRLSIYQTDLQYALMKAIQELNAKVDAQALEIQALKGVA